MSKKGLWLLLVVAIGAATALALAAVHHAAPASAPLPTPTGPIRAMTANIRYADPGDGANAWPLRRDLLVRTILKQDLDLLACQEVTPAQQAYLVKELANWYTHYPRPGVGQIGPATAGGLSGELMSALSASAAGLNTLFYRTTRFDQIDGEAGLVLPESPQATPSENTFYTLAVLHDRSTGAGHLPDLIVIDTHIRHNEDFAVKCAQRLHDLAAAQQKKHPSSQVILLGDINHDRTSPVHGALLGNALPADKRWADAFDYGAHKATDLWGTFHNFTGRSDRAWPTDLIFASPGLKASPAEILRDAEKGKYPTDHFLVQTTITVGG